MNEKTKELAWRILPISLGTALLFGLTSQSLKVALLFGGCVVGGLLLGSAITAIVTACKKLS